MRNEKQIIKELLEKQTEILIELKIKERYLNSKILSEGQKQELLLDLGRVQAMIKGGEDFLEFLKRQ